MKNGTVARSSSHRIARGYVVHAWERRLRQTFHTLTSTTCASCRRECHTSFLQQQRRLRDVAVTRSKTTKSKPSKTVKRSLTTQTEKRSVPPDKPSVKTTEITANERYQALARPIKTEVPAVTTTLRKSPDVVKAVSWGKAPVSAAPTVSTTTAKQDPKPTPSVARTATVTQNPAVAPHAAPKTIVKHGIESPSTDGVGKPVVASGRVAKAWPSGVGKAKVRGLSNPHNWCYRRSLLQSLFSVPQFFNLLNSAHGKCSSSRANCVTCKLRQLVLSYHGSSGNVGKDLKDFDQVVKITGKKSDPKWQGTGTSQEDSHEFLQYLMGTIEKAQGIQKQQFQSTFLVGHKTTWKCLHCNKEHTKVDPPSYSLQLPIHAPRGQALTLKTCLDSYHREDNLTIRCDGCRKNVPRTRFHRIQDPPEVLFIQFKRFAFNGYNSAKNSKRVQYTDTLDLAPWSVNTTRPVNYRLQAVVAHSGSLRMGHYIACVQHSDGVRRISDESVQKVSADELRNPRGFDPYILCYMKE